MIFGFAYQASREARMLSGCSQGLEVDISICHLQVSQSVHQIGARGLDLPEERLADGLRGGVVLLLEAVGAGNAAALRVEHRHLDAGIMRSSSIE